MNFQKKQVTFKQFLKIIIWKILNESSLQIIILQIFKKLIFHDNFFRFSSKQKNHLIQSVTFKITDTSENVMKKKKKQKLFSFEPFPRYLTWRGSYCFHQVSYKKHKTVGHNQRKILWFYFLTVMQFKSVFWGVLRFS